MNHAQDSSDAIRRRMADSRSRISEKLQSLEEQVFGTVQSTGTAVSETAAAVKETVDVITHAVHGAVKSVGDTFDVREQMKHHPWLLVGGAVAVGYLAHELSRRPQKTPSAGNDETRDSASDIGENDDAIVTRRQGTTEHPPSCLGVLAAHVMRAAATLLSESLRQVATQAVPLIADYLVRHEPRSSRAKSNGTTH